MKSCELYPLFSLKAVLRVWQTNYCRGNFIDCVRYDLSCDGKAIPLNLLPNGKYLQMSEVETAK